MAKLKPLAVLAVGCSDRDTSLLEATFDELRVPLFNGVQRVGSEDTLAHLSEHPGYDLIFSYHPLNATLPPRTRFIPLVQGDERPLDDYLRLAITHTMRVDHGRHYNMRSLAL